MQTGDCDLAIAGGVNALLSPELFISFGKAGMLAPDGRCKTFSKGANGYVRGEGVGAILLKPLDKAITDGDHIYGVIRGTSENHGGRANSLTAPNPRAQADLLVTAYERAGILPDTVSYIEAHGTGTELGDPVEVNGLKKAFAELYSRSDKVRKKSNYCGLGSVKSNIGHLETAAGIAGVIKILLSMKHKRIPASINVKEINPYIDIKESPFYLVDKTLEWSNLRDVDNKPIPRRAGVSSFGFGGANAHIVLEEYEDSRERATSINLNKPDEGSLIVLSAKSDGQVKEYAKRLKFFLINNIKENEQNRGRHGENKLTDVENLPALRDIAYTLQIGRENYEERLAMIVKDESGLIQMLDDYLDGRDSIQGLYSGNIKTNGERSIILDNDEEDVEYVNFVVSNRKLTKIARLWLAGINIEWDLLYSDNPAKRISLPTYPFERERYWVSSVKDTVDTVPLNSGYGNILYYQPIWKRLNLTGSEVKRETGSVLIFQKGEESVHNAGPVTNEIDSLEDAVYVSPGPRFSRLSETEYQINPENQGDYLRLLEETCCQKPGPVSIIHLWNYLSVDISELCKDDIKEDLNRGLFSIFYLSKAIIGLKFEKGLRVLYLFHRSKKITQPQDAAVSGYAKTIKLEHPGYDFKVIQVDRKETDTEVLNIAIRELHSVENNDQTEILYKNNKRFVRRVSELDIKEDIGDKQIPLREKGVYLITGGTGGIGLIFAKYLGDRYQARLVLTGRSHLSKEKQEKIREIEKSGGEVIYVQSDICKSDDMERVIRATRERFKKLDGVIHSAGVIDDTLIIKKERDSFENVISPKLYGLLNLDQVTKDEDLDFFVLFSSLSSVIGNIGQCDYSSGNSFMDSYVETRELLRAEGKRKGISLSINWPLWKEGGMALSVEAEQMMLNSYGIRVLNSAQGVKAFESALVSEQPQVIVIDGEKDKVDKLLQVQHTEKNIITSDTVAVARDLKCENEKTLNVVAGKKEDISMFLLKTISGIMNIDMDRIDPDADLHDLGIDSILGMQIVQEIESYYGLKLYPRELLEYNTIEKLTSYLEKELTQLQPVTIQEKANDNGAKREKPLIYILSTPRSGSTLLRVMMMGHSKLFAPPELYLLPFDTLEKRKGLLTKSNQIYFREGFIEAIKDLEGLSLEKAKERMQELETKNLTISESYQYLQKLAGDRYVVDKSPSYAMDKSILERAEEISQNPFYIYLVRHPLAVMESFVRNRFDKMLGIKEDPWLFSEKMWREMNANIRSFLSTKPQNRWAEIRYEDLVRNPEKTMKSLCSYLNIEFEKSMLSPYDGNKMTKGIHGVSIQIGDPNFTKHRKIESKFANIWEKHLDKSNQLSPQTIRLAEELNYKINTSKGIRLSPSQTSFLDRFGPDPVWYIVQSYKTHFNEGFEIGRFKDSLQRVVNKHAVLRNTFLLEKGKWTQYEQENTEPSVIYEDVSNLDDNAKRKRFKDIERKLNRMLKIHTAPLLSCGVAALGEGQYQVIFVIHHLIADGASIELVRKELFEFYQNPEMNIGEIDRQYAKYVDELFQLERNGVIVDHEKFWSKRIEGIQRKFPVDFNNGPNNIASEKEYSARYSFAELGVEDSRQKSSFFDYLSVGLYHCLSKWSKQKKLVITHRLHRRDTGLNGQYHNAMGWFAGDVPISLAFEQETSVRGLIQDFKEKYRQIPMGGVTYEILSNQGLLPYAHEIGPVRLNYQPEINTSNIKNVETHIFESPGHDRLYLLDLIVRMRKDHLVLIARYSRNKYRHITIKKLVSEWMQMTKLIIKDSFDSHKKHNP
ncbi:polyketide synthase/nonribosomal peptide synthetase [Candidatus Scalindua japonica]|uniref:Polyketide synthase/nonribosomal peptide synthetase n=2 Tax=Candidatus Scalindua japonica TaxID=1284222 RepID=A0A286TWJ1_9BACT|nr:polyketide synthase/nonribosomal peptide synthetase [Candidatus Scalindua japonica]